MKKRRIKGTEEVREVLRGLGYSFTKDAKDNWLFIKVTNSEFSVIKEIITE